MVANLILGLLAILFPLMLKNKVRGLKLSMSLLTIFLSLRYYWGNDYGAYLLEYQELNSFYNNIFDLSGTNRSANNEIGWVVINRLFGALGLGFFGLVISLTVFENFIIYKVIKKWVPENCFYIAVFFYVFNTSFFAIGASMMRQFLCICLYFIVYLLMVEKKVKLYYLWSIVIILLGATIHRSNFFLLFTLPLFFIKIRNSRWYIFTYITIISTFFIWEYLAPMYVEDSIIDLIENNPDLEEYMAYLHKEEDSLSTGFGLIFRYLFMIYLFYILPQLEGKNQLIILLFLVSDFLYPFMRIAPMFSRFIYYFAYLLFILWPILLNELKKGIVVKLLFILHLMIVVKSFFDFYYSPIWIKSFLYYRSILSAPYWM